MSGKVRLEVIEGPMQGKEFIFEEHDTFLFGRLKECHAYLPDDPKVSRNHFILEANPPDVHIRDLGSMNGTYINGVKYGGRDNDKTSEIDLKDNDQIKVGDTVMKVSIHVPAVCCDCGKDIADNAKEQCAWLGDTFICPACKQKMSDEEEKERLKQQKLAEERPRRKLEPVRCKKCAKDVSKEVGARRGDYICQSCQGKIKDDPLYIPRELHRGPVIIGGDKAGPRHPQRVLKIPNPTPRAQDIRLGKPTPETPKIENYDVIKKLDNGAFGAVYLARCKKDNKDVALKIMLSQVAVSEKNRKMFQREIDVMQSLQHNNIVFLVDHGSSGNVFYFIMEFCESGNVYNLMNKYKGKLPLSQAAPIMLQALEGLAYAHHESFVHRDLKPPNILLNKSNGRLIAKIADFGLSKNFDKAGFTSITVTGAFAGTAEFMPREQVTNYKRVKPVSDVWSIGATFYNMLTGKFPRDIRRGQDPIQAILIGNIIPIQRRDSSIPRKVAEVIDRSLVNNIKERYQNAGEMHRALAKVL